MTLWSFTANWAVHIFWHECDESGEVNAKDMHVVCVLMGMGTVDRDGSTLHDTIGSRLLDLFISWGLSSSGLLGLYA